MNEVWLIAVLVFIISMLLYWRIMSYWSKKEVGKKMHKQWNSRLYFWQGAIFTSTGITFLSIYVLRWLDVLNF